MIDKCTLTGKYPIKKDLLNDGSLICKNENISSGEALYKLVSYRKPVYKIASDYPSHLGLGQTISYTIKIWCINQKDPGNTHQIHINIPEGFKYETHYSEHDGNYSPSTETWTIKLQNQEASLQLFLTATTIGTYKQQISSTDIPIFQAKNCKITEENMEIYSTHLETHQILQKSLTNLQKGHLYTLSMNLKINDPHQDTIHQGNRNNRLAIIQGSKTILGEQSTKMGRYERIAVSFIHQEKYSLGFQIFGQYRNVSLLETSNFGAFTLQEEFQREYIESNEALIKDPQKILSSNTEKIEHKIQAGEQIKRYTYTTPSNLNIKPGMELNGIEIELYSYTEGLEIEAQLINENQETSKKISQYSIKDELIRFGDPTELWDLKTTTLRNAPLKLHLTIRNRSKESIYAEFNQLKIIYYTRDHTRLGKYGFTYNNKHSNQFGIILNNDSNNLGLNSTLNSSNLEKYPGNIITGMEIKGKELEFEITLEYETLEEGYTWLRHINRWLTNDIDTWGIPLPETLTLDYEPNIELKAIASQEIHITKEHPLLKAKIKFTLPDGVIYSTKPVVTFGKGENKGLTPVRPEILIRTNGNSKITIADKNTPGNLIIDGYIQSGEYLIINCKNRTIKSLQNNDYTSLVSLDSTWPLIHKKYEYTASGAEIINVKHHETQ